MKKYLVKWGLKFLICIAFISNSCVGVLFFFKTANGGWITQFFTFSFCLILHNRLMYSQITEKQIASKEVIKDQMNLCVGFFCSTDIYRNICSTPVVGKALCLVWPLNPTFKNTCVGLNSL